MSEVLTHPSEALVREAGGSVQYLHAFDGTAIEAESPHATPTTFSIKALAVDTQAVIDHLNEILKHEWTGVAQYSQAGFIVEGLWREVYSERFLGDAKESFGHAKLVGEKIVALGGVPAVTRNDVKQSRNLQEVLEFSLAFEGKAVEMYSRAIEMAEELGDRALVVFLEDILKEEQEGVDEYTKLLRTTESAAGAVGGSKQKQKGA